MKSQLNNRSIQQKAFVTMQNFFYTFQETVCSAKAHLKLLTKHFIEIYSRSFYYLKRHMSREKHEVFIT